MNILTQEAHRRQSAVKLAMRKGKSYASRMYGVSLSSVKRWRKRRSRSRYKRAQTDNGTEFTCRFISEGKPCPFDTALEEAGVAHKPIPPRTPWHNGKVERSHRNDQRYFYDREKFGDVEELNRKPTGHPEWSNNKTMRTPGRKSPAERLAAIQGGV